MAYAILVPSRAPPNLYHDLNLQIYFFRRHCESDSFILLVVRSDKVPSNVIAIIRQVALNSVCTLLSHAPQSQVTGASTHRRGLDCRPGSSARLPNRDFLHRTREAGLARCRRRLCAEGEDDEYADSPPPPLSHRRRRARPFRRPVLLDAVTSRVCA